MNGNTFNSFEYNSENFWNQFARTITGKGSILVEVLKQISGRASIGQGEYLSIGGLEMSKPTSSIIRPLYPASIETLGGFSRKDVLGRKYVYEIQWNFMKKEEYDNLEGVVNTGIPVHLFYTKFPQSENFILVIPTIEERTHVALADTDDFYSNVRVRLTEISNRV